MPQKIRDALFHNGEFKYWADSEKGMFYVQTAIDFRLGMDGWERKPYVAPDDMLKNAIISLRNAQRRMFAARRENGDPGNKSYFERNFYLHLIREVNAPKMILKTYRCGTEKRTNAWLEDNHWRYKNIYIVELEEPDKDYNSFIIFYGNLTENSVYHTDSKGNRYQ